MIAALSLLAVFTTAALGINVQVSKPTSDANGTHTTYSPVYDDASESTSAVDCAGAIIANQATWTTFGDLPNFPNIAGASVVSTYDSDWCGSCWALTYQGTRVNVMVIDSAADGFNIAESTMNELTNGQAANIGVIDVDVEELTTTQCGWR